MECIPGNKRYDLDKLQDKFWSVLEKLGWNIACEEDPLESR